MGTWDTACLQRWAQWETLLTAPRYQFTVLIVALRTQSELWPLGSCTHLSSVPPGFCTLRELVLLLFALGALQRQCFRIQLSKTTDFST